MSPSAGSLDPVTAAAGYGRSTSGVYDNAIAMIERRCEAGITVAARRDFRVRPDLKANSFERAPVFLCCATGKVNSSAIDLLRQFAKERAQTFGCGEAKIRRLQFSVVENAKITTGITPRLRGYSFNQHPGGFRAAAFHPENALTGFHDWVCITGFLEMKRWIGSPWRADAKEIAEGANIRSASLGNALGTTRSTFCRKFACSYREKIDGSNRSQEKDRATARRNRQA
jgi:hypothetical protein